jgi:hypothetical protein
MLITLGPSTAAPAKAETGRPAKLIAITKSKIQEAQFIRCEGGRIFRGVWKIRFKRFPALQFYARQPACTSRETASAALRLKTPPLSPLRAAANDRQGVSFLRYALHSDLSLQ